MSDYRAVLAILGVSLFACDKAKVEERLYFADLKPIVGVEVNVVSDVSLNPTTGGTIAVHAAVDADLDRDELDRLMRSFWRQLEARRTFRQGEADRIDLRFYGAEAKAKAGGDDWLARASRRTRAGEPNFDNRQRYPLLKWAKKKLGKQPQFTGALKPELVADADAMELQVKVPFVKADGTGEYVDPLTFTRATTELSSYAMALFDGIEQLKKLTFEGSHNGQVAIRVVLTREQYQQVNLRQVEEGMGAFQGKFINQLMAKPGSEKKIRKKVTAERRKVYKKVFDQLPPDQVVLVKGLQ